LIDLRKVIIKTGLEGVVWGGGGRTWTGSIWLKKEAGGGLL